MLRWPYIRRTTDILLLSRTYFSFLGSKNMGLSDFVTWMSQPCGVSELLARTLRNS